MAHPSAEKLKADLRQGRRTCGPSECLGLHLLSSLTTLQAGWSWWELGVQLQEGQMFPLPDLYTRALSSTRWGFNGEPVWLAVNVDSWALFWHTDCQGRTTKNFHPSWASTPNWLCPSECPSNLAQITLSNTYSFYSHLRHQLLNGKVT